MNYVPLPTDNLYKFIALSGLAIILVSLFYPLRLVVDLELKAAGAMGQIQETTDLIEETERALSDIEKSESPTAAQVNEAARKHKLARQSSNRDIPIGAELQVLRAQLDGIKSVSRIGIALGTIMTAFGFYFWYVRVQRPADRLASRQANEHVT